MFTLAVGPYSANVVTHPSVQPSETWELQQREISQSSLYYEKVIYRL